MSNAPSGEKTHKCADLSCSASDEALANGGQETGEKKLHFAAREASQNGQTYSCVLEN